MKPIWILAVTAGTLLLGGCEKAQLDEEVKRLCAKDGGVQVLETVMLPESEYQKLLDQYAELRVPSKRNAKPSDSFYYQEETTYLKEGNPEMWRSEYRLIRKSDEKILATSIFYTRRGGDFPGPWHDSSFTCPATKSSPRMAELAIKKIK